MIYWFTTNQFDSTNKVDTATIYRPRISSTFPTPEEFMQPLDFNNNYVEA